MRKNKNVEKTKHGDSKNKNHNFLAFIICVLISLTIWVYVANVEILRANNDIPNDGYQNSETEQR